jgi:hypothetical protein
MSLRQVIGIRSRPVRRKLTPWQFKESYINEALADRSPSLYVEIGVRWGESLRQVNAHRKIGIDIEQHSALAPLRPGESFFEMASDDFFAREAAQVLAAEGVDVALVDGLHEFSQTLRDVLNLERFMKSDGVIIVDDCNPPTSDRAVDTPTGGTWNGDVWKIAAYLREERPDLHYWTVDADQGVGVVTGFGSAAPWPDESTVRRYKALPYSHLAGNRAKVLNLVPPGPGQIRP